MSKVTSQELRDSVLFWQQHQVALRERNLCTEEAMRWLHVYTQPDNIGYEFGMLRPGKLGQWDLYDHTMEMLPQDQRLLISGLSASEIAVSDRDDCYCLDPSDPNYEREVAEIQRMEAMSQEEIDFEIARLESLLS